ncbi:MAG: hypothetical protein ACKOJF_24900, partial [Planctomycetaceae bacterium]
VAFRFSPQPEMWSLAGTALLELVAVALCLRSRWLSGWCWLLAAVNAGCAALHLGQALLSSTPYIHSLELFSLGAEGTARLGVAVRLLLEALRVVGLGGLLLDLTRQLAFLRAATRPHDGSDRGEAPVVSEPRPGRPGSARP